VIATALAFAAAALGVAGGGLLLWPGKPGGSRAQDIPRSLRLLTAAGRRVRRAELGAPRELEARVAAAGRPGGLGVRELMGAKLAGAVVAGLAGSVWAPLMPGRLGSALVLAAPVAGFLGPDLWLRRRSAQRARRARRELPALLDLLRVTVQAGGGLPEALRDVGERAEGPLAAEWRATGREVALGVPLKQALDDMTRRLPLPEIRSLAAALDRARRHGAPLAGTLEAQARDARAALRRHIQEEAARAGPKIQLVVALLLVPSVLLLVAAALAAALVDSGGGLLPV
jgi:tight adherence protein C